LAASNSTSQTSNTPGVQSTQSIPAELQNKLRDAGFSDVKIVPSSFVVQAKDKQGYPVLMQISPDSMTMLTAVPANSSTTGSGSNGSNSSSSSGGNSNTGSSPTSK
jgi:hypothetical protein